MTKTIVALLAALSVVSTAAAQGTGLQIVPEKADADDNACGITQPSLVSAATLALKNANVNVVVKSNPYLHISTTTLQGSGRCSVYLKVSVSEALTKHVPAGAFKPKKAISARLCSQEDLLAGPQSTMGGRVHKQLEESIKACLADLHY
jgi:hypothetical protein